MHRALALLDLAVMVASVGALVVGRGRPWAWALLIASGAWLPLNNGLLEGPVLIRVVADHGLTVSDLLGILGAVGAGLLLWPPRRGRSARWVVSRAGVVVGVLAVGFAAAMVVTNDRVDRKDRIRDRQYRHEVQRSSLDIRRSASGLPPVWQVGQYWNDLS